MSPAPSFGFDVSPAFLIAALTMAGLVAAVALPALRRTAGSRRALRSIALTAALLGLLGLALRPWSLARNSTDTAVLVTPGDDGPSEAGIGDVAAAEAEESGRPNPPSSAAGRPRSEQVGDSADAATAKRQHDRAAATPTIPPNDDSQNRGGFTDGSGNRSLETPSKTAAAPHSPPADEPDAAPASSPLRVSSAAAPGGWTTLPDARTLWRREPGLRGLEVRGYGLDAADLAGFTGRVARFAPPPLPIGVMTALWPRRLPLGTPLLVEARTTPASDGRIELLGPGGVEDSADGEQARRGVTLHAHPRTAGRFLYRLVVRDKTGHEAAGELLDVAVTPPLPPRVVARFAAPSFESRALLRFLASAGVPYAASLDLTRDRTRLESSWPAAFGPRPAVSTLDVASLAAADVLLLDGRSWKALSAAERAAIAAAIEGGLGVLLFDTDPTAGEETGFPLRSRSLSPAAPGARSDPAGASTATPGTGAADLAHSPATPGAAAAHTIDPRGTAAGGSAAGAAGVSVAGIRSGAVGSGASAVGSRAGAVGSGAGAVGSGVGAVGSGAGAVSSDAGAAGMGAGAVSSGAGATGSGVGTTGSGVGTTGSGAGAAGSGAATAGSGAGVADVSAGKVGSGSPERRTAAAAASGSAGVAKEADGGEPAAAPGREERLSWPGQEPLPAILLPERALAPAPAAEPLIRDARDRVVAARLRRGRGTVALSLVADTYQWTLGADAAAHAALWTRLLGAIARPATAPQFVLPSGPILVDRPLAATLVAPPGPMAKSGAGAAPAPGGARAAAGNAGAVGGAPAGAGSAAGLLTPRITLDDGMTAEPLPVLPLSPGRHTTRFWPRAAGWLRLSSSDGATAWIYAAGPSAWRAWRAARRVEATRAKAAGANTPTAPQESRPAVAKRRWPRLLFFGLFLSALALLWIDERFQGPRSVTPPIRPS